MKKNINLLTLIFYIVFTQIYPVVHWHEQEHHGEAELQLSIHPAEVDPNLYDHHQHEEDNDLHEHKHKDKHYDGDLDYLNQSKLPFSVIYDISALTKEIDYLEAQVSERTPISIPLKIPNPFYPLAKQNRAPPFLS